MTNEVRGAVLAGRIAHLWRPTEAPHPALRAEPYMRSRCGRVVRHRDIFEFRDSENCARCFPESSGRTA